MSSHALSAKEATGTWLHLKEWEGPRNVGMLLQPFLGNYTVPHLHVSEEKDTVILLVGSSIQKSKYHPGSVSFFHIYAQLIRHSCQLDTSHTWDLYLRESQVNGFGSLRIDHQIPFICSYISLPMQPRHRSALPADKISKDKVDHSMVITGAIHYSKCPQMIYKYRMGTGKIWQNWFNNSTLIYKIFFS